MLRRQRNRTLALYIELVENLLCNMSQSTSDLTETYRVLLVGEVATGVIREVERGYPSGELGVVLQAPARGTVSQEE